MFICLGRKMDGSELHTSMEVKGTGDFATQILEMFS